MKEFAFRFCNVGVEFAYASAGWDNKMTISIAPITSIEECRLIEQLQAEIWESSDLEVAPDHLIWTIAKEGGLVLLARNEQGKPIGFAYGFLARTTDKHLKLASHQAGVVAAYQDQDIGYQLKLAQRELALKAGLDLITWTYDPLQGRNANLNLRKLGVVCNTYIPNLYGMMRDELNQGLPSDRFRVDWWLDTKRVEACLTNHAIYPHPAPDFSVLNPSTPIAEGILVPSNNVGPMEEEFYLVEFPRDINRLKVVAPDVALQWRFHTRQIFQAAFGAGYTVVDLRPQPDRNYYLLQKNWQRK